MIHLSMVTSLSLKHILTSINFEFFHFDWIIYQSFLYFNINKISTLHVYMPYTFILEGREVQELVYHILNIIKHFPLVLTWAYNSFIYRWVVRIFFANKFCSHFYPKRILKRKLLIKSRTQKTYQYIHIVWYWEYGNFLRIFIILLIVQIPRMSTILNQR